MASTMDKPAKIPPVSASGTPAGTPPKTAAGPVNVRTPEKGAGPRVGRRALLVTATAATLCGAGMFAAPQVTTALEAQAQAMGRAAILNEIGDLEGVSLDAAIRTAEITRMAVKLVVFPLARFVAAVGSGAFDLLLKVVDTLRGVAGPVGVNISQLNAFRDMVVSWRGSVSALPITLDAYLTADIESAEKYLRALKQLAEHPHFT
ncbi:MAG TPA: hypothetical protein VF808_06915 [Ktedonobacterales bacterium]